MKNLRPAFAAVCLAVLSLTACKKEVKEAMPAEISEGAASQIRSLGFSTEGALKTADGYLVEGDILLTEAELNARPTSPNLMIAQEEQYRTFNMVDPSRHATINIALDNASSQHDAAFTAALDEAINRYNALNLQVKFARVSKTQAHDITVVAFYENSSTLGSAGFPNSAGDPYSQVRMNTYHYSTGIDPTNVNYIATIMAHEVGHCVGFRHTDYMRRAFSCGSGGNEGQAKNGVGAVHIPGTPTTADAASWMLACIGKGVNRPFNANDQVALKYVY